MTDDGMALVELLQKSGDGDFLRAVAEAVLQILMEADVEGLIDAGRHERSTERLNYPNEASITRLIGAVLLEQNDEWLLQCRYMQIEGMAELTPPLIEADPAKLPPLAA